MFYVDIAIYIAYNSFISFELQTKSH